MKMIYPDPCMLQKSTALLEIVRMMACLASRRQRVLQSTDKGFAGTVWFL